MQLSCIDRRCKKLVDLMRLSRSGKFSFFFSQFSLILFSGKEIADNCLMSRSFVQGHWLLLCSGWFKEFLWNKMQCSYFFTRLLVVEKITWQGACLSSRSRIVDSVEQNYWTNCLCYKCFKEYVLCLVFPSLWIEYWATWRGSVPHRHQSVRNLPFLTWFVWRGSASG
jgi:hypothetical protein